MRGVVDRPTAAAPGVANSSSLIIVSALPSTRHYSTAVCHRLVLSGEVYSGRDQPPGQRRLLDACLASTLLRAAPSRSSFAQLLRAASIDEYLYCFYSFIMHAAFEDSLLRHDIRRTLYDVSTIYEQTY